MFTCYLSLQILSCKKNENEPKPIAANSTKKEISATTANTILSSDIHNNIQFVGRWCNFNQVSNWGGAYIKAKFTGTTVKLKVSDTLVNYYYAKIDDEPYWKKYAVTGPSTIDLTPVPLDSGTHTLMIAQGKDYHYQFNFQGLVLDEGATTLPISISNKFIEYCGDSITAGYTDSKAEVSDYAWLTADLLGAEHTQIAYPGICLVNGMENQFFKQNCKGPGDWNFADHTPDIIVINLGTNDDIHKIVDTTFRRSYIQFLKNIRAKFPQVKICVMRPFNGAKATVIKGVVQARNNASDHQVYYIDTTNWITEADTNDGLHPSDKGQQKIAGFLTPLLQKYLGK